MRFGLRLPLSDSRTAASSPLPHLIDTARAAEQSGYDFVGVAEGSDAVAGDSSAALEPYTLLGALATSTTVARLGALASPVGARPPSLLAKQVTAVDVISGGRAVLGVRPASGLGPRRYARLEEAVSVCRAMFGSEQSTVPGRFFPIVEAANRPPPTQPGGPPVMIAGRGGRQLLQVAVRVADALHLEVPPQRLRLLRRALGQLSQSAGRSDHQLAVSVTVVAAPDAWAAPGRSAPGRSALVAEVLHAFDAGADGVVLDAPAGVDPDAVADVGRVLVEEFGAAPGGR